ncbi:putative collar [Achromobacter phage CF418P1]|uniref:phage tail protein n=1 Tax=Alcaligenes xylosoxydans xylosoxydans TaxID=85698 RepID=UPI0012A97F20|nr:phage tail protein [Achromobacter xylosoxidans]WNO49177.1 putative collar [Achromobacter phage CF418P1]CUR74750.1 Phage Tail Collar Domain protein [Achromobacter xylosoxidans]
MARLLTLRRNLARLLTRDEVDDNFVNVASDFSGAVDPATLTGAYVAPYMRWADTGTGWLKRRNSANDGWVSEQRLLRRTVQPFNTSELPTADGGPIYVNGQGMAEFDAAAGKYRVVSPVPVGAVAWWPLRSSMPAGRIPADGQTISRATFPDLAAMVLAGTVPLATEADWLADPRNRGCYTAGDGSTTIRVPDLNGRSSGSLGRVFLSGDGMDAAPVGVIQPDQFQNHGHLINIKTSQGGSPAEYGTVPYGQGANSQYSTVDAPVQNGAPNGVPRVGNKTHPQNVAGAWTIQAFGAVTNPGAADAAQLATDYATLNAAFQTMRGQVFGFNQTWQNVAASRSLGVIYTNTTGRPILVQVYTTSTAAAGYLFFAIDETPAGLVYYPNSAANLPGCILVPAGSTYRASTTNASLSGWREYR